MFPKNDNNIKVRDTILTINVVEKELVRAVKLQSKALKRTLYGLALVNKNYADLPDRPKDTTGLFEEIVCDFDNPDELQRILKPYSDRLLAATCRYEEAIQDFGKVIPFLPSYLPLPSPDALLGATEKPVMRDRLKDYDSTLVPRYQYMEKNDLPNLSELVKDFNYPVIIKPSGLAKALFVTRCNSLQELQERLEYTFLVINQAYEREQYPGKPALLVEEMMQGQMYSVDAYVTQEAEILCLPPIKVITAHSLGLPGFYGCQCLTTDLEEDEVQGAFTASKGAIRALNLTSTTTHIELFRTPEGWKIIEIAARIGGHRDYLYREAYGIEHFYNDLSLRMGKRPEMPTKQIGYAVALNIYAEQEGYIESITGLEQAREISSVVYLACHAEKGDIALFANNGGDAVIDGVLSNKDQKQLQKDIVAVQSLIKINVRKKERKARKNDYAVVQQL
jgi:hypothetical protein